MTHAEAQLYILAAVTVADVVLTAPWALSKIQRVTLEFEDWTARLLVFFGSPEAVWVAKAVFAGLTFVLWHYLTLVLPQAGWLFTVGMAWAYLTPIRSNLRIIWRKA